MAEVVPNNGTDARLNLDLCRKRALDAKQKLLQSGKHVNPYAISKITGQNRAFIKTVLDGEKPMED
jgi:hypothetical protein